jgi:GH15 family glucan-1,4-alpha-glucosidase
MDFLTTKSVELLLSYQSTEGAFYACPNFDTYRYSWFRDGSFCALALSEFGHEREAWKFIEWSTGVVLRYQEKIRRTIQAASNGEELIAADCFHSRFTLAGLEVPGNWGHNQLDGLGTWLWLIGQFRQQHCSLPMPAEVAQAAGLVKDYLTALWKLPCSDCWEEHEDMLHTYTLASISAGLKSYSQLFADPQAAACAEEIKTFILKNCVHAGAFIKSIPADGTRSKLLLGVDANLIALNTPYQLFDWQDPLFQNTLARIERDLLTPGLHRYKGDSYYGSGEWVLLTEWLGWAYARAGEMEKARTILTWSRQQASKEGYLPEQVPHGLFVPAGYPEWVERWGEIASPLLWSHAKYLLLVKSINGAGEK